jgi:hypothetical protein
MNYDGAPVVAQITTTVMMRGSFAFSSGSIVLAGAERRKLPPGSFPVRTPRQLRGPTKPVVYRVRVDTIDHA